MAGAISFKARLSVGEWISGIISFSTLSAQSRLSLVAGILIIVSFISSPPFFGTGNQLARAVTTQTSGIPVHGEEFVGPFPSWANVKAQYGAVRNGITDDTIALQSALNDLGQVGKSSVIWLPRGTYRITGTLMLTSRQNIGIIGKNPTTTKIVWDGPSGGTMAHFNGVAYSRFNRITWDGAGKASKLVNQSKASASIPYFDTGNEYTDSIFKDAEYGIYGGHMGHGFAETSVLRSAFIRLSRAGISLGNFNALDLWVWDSKFEDCNIGVTNAFGAGGFHVYQSTFLNSTTSDMSIGNTGTFNIHKNFSVGSKRFFQGAGTGNAGIITIHGNTILDPLDPKTVQNGNLGPVLFVDNVIRSSSSVITGPIVNVASFRFSDLFSVGNTFTTNNPLFANGRLRSVDDQVVSRSAVNPAPPTLPGFLPNLNRPLFEVPTGSSAATIQGMINMAALERGSRPVVHLPRGTYSIAETIILPANTDIQLIGDGGSTVINWGGSGRGPVLRMRGPSKITVRDVKIKGTSHTAVAIIVENADQPGGSVFMEQAFLSHYAKHNLLVDGLDHTVVELHNFKHAYGYGGTKTGTSIKVVGGPRAASGNWQGGKVNLFSGASSDNPASYDFSSGARVLVRDVWYETNSNLYSNFLRISGNGAATFQGSRLAFPVSTTSAAVHLDDFTGTAAFLELRLDRPLSTGGDGSQSTVLGSGLVGPSTSYMFNTAVPPTDVRLFNNWTWNTTATSGTGALTIPDAGAFDPAYVRTALAQTRSEQPITHFSRSDGVTDVRLFRVFTETMRTGIRINRSKPAFAG